MLGKPVKPVSLRLLPAEHTLGYSKEWFLSREAARG